MLTSEVNMNQILNLESVQKFISPTPLQKSKRSAIVQTFYLDIGSSVTKAGNLDVNKEPTLICPSKTFRIKRQGQDYPISGNNIFYEASKVTPKPVHEFIKTNDSKPLEDFLDYSFTELEVAQEDRLIFTEPLGLIPKFRESMFELCFECYGLKEIMPIVESIAAGYQMWKQFKKADSVLISIGSYQTSILPFVNCNLDTLGVRRIGVGVDTMKSTFSKLFNFKYNSFSKQLSQKQLWNMFDHYGYMAYNYKSQMKIYSQIDFSPANLQKSAWEEDQSVYKLRGLLNISNIPSEIEKIKVESEKATNEQRRQEIFKRLANKLKEGKELKRKNMENELETLEKNEKMIEQSSKTNIKQILETIGFQREEDLVVRIDILRKKLGKEKIPVDMSEKMALLDIPDEELSPRRLRSKKYLYLQKSNYEKRQKKRIEKELKTKEIDRLKTENSAGYVNELKLKRQHLKTKIKRIKYFNEDPNFKKRKDNQLIENLDNMLEGKNDATNAEFDSYINELMDISSDCEKYETEIQLLNEQIREVDREFDDELDNEDLFLSRKYESSDRVGMSHDLVRSIEILNRPYIIGSQQSGLFESLSSLIGAYELEMRTRMLKNIFVVGGGGQISGLHERLQNDLFLHFSGIGITDVNVVAVEDCLLTGYSGARSFYFDFQDKLESWMYTKSDYEEHGPRLFKTCPIGNI